LSIVDGVRVDTNAEVLKADGVTGSNIRMWHEIDAHAQKRHWGHNDEIGMTYHHTSGGRLGIGTTSPEGVLEIEQSSTTGHALKVYRNQSSSNMDSSLVFLHDDSQYADEATLHVKQDGTGIAGIFEVNDAAALEWIAELRNTPNPQAPTNFGAGIKLALSSGSGNELLKWAGMAAVKSPDLNYSRRVDAAFYTQTDAGNSADPTEKMRITGDGNVGIGNTSPLTPLHITSTTTTLDNLLTLENNGASGTPGVGIKMFSNVGTINYLEILHDAYGNTNFKTTNGASTYDKQMYLQDDGLVTFEAGDVGIGTTSPTFTSGGGLHIKNSSQANVTQVNTSTCRC
jgi:hypothetical protein